MCKIDCFSFWLSKYNYIASCKDSLDFIHTNYG